jgi:hypothetical protein
MKTKRVILFASALVFLLGTISANATSSGSAAVNQPWTVQLLKADEDAVRNLSAAHVGTYQIPILSYNRVGLHVIYVAHPKTSATIGNCGPNNTWFCYGRWLDNALIDGTVSQMATMQIFDTHLIQWAYATATTIRGVTFEFHNDMSDATHSYQDLIQLNKFGGVLIGSPSLQTVGGHYWMATTIRSGGDFPTYKLVYMQYVGGSSNTSCMGSGNGYQCVVIDESTGYDSMGAPSLQIAPDGTIGIAYYKYGGGVTDGVKYAYPHTHSATYPSNCGPGDPKTWRCISIYTGAATGTFRPVVKFALGQTQSDRGVVFTYDDEMIDVTIFHAEYVGSGGNCGMDGSLINPNIYRWKCTDVAILGPLSPLYSPSYSIDIDPEGYPVIAYNAGVGEYEPINLYITYPKARVGIAENGWIAQAIDGVPAPYTEISTGAEAALSLSNAGLGLIGYLQEEDYELPDLKTAWQQFHTFLPSVMR